MNYFYDFKNETILSSWRETEKKNGHIFIQCDFESKAGEKLLLWDLWRKGAPWEPQILSVNGISVDTLDPLYVRPNGSRYGMRIMFRDGINTITAEILPRQYRIEKFKMFLIDLPGRAGTVESRQETWIPPVSDIPPEMSCSSEGFTPGLGRSVMPGRFGYDKGDGLLDCAMSWFGIVTKMYLCGDPRYRKPHVWSYSLRQDAEDPEAMESVEVNQLSVHWKRGGVSYRYSLATPGIVTEVVSGDVKISKLEFAGDYHFIMTADEISTLDRFSGRMAENWLLLCGSETFPDIPILIVLECKPYRIDLEYTLDGHLSKLIFCGCQKMTTATPFGIESPEPGKIYDRMFREDAAKRCRFWSRTFLAFPVNVKDYYQISREEKSVNIVQEFEYLECADAWWTLPLRLAPLPPMLTLSGQSLPQGVADFHFPTKYGKLCGFSGSRSAYRVDRITSTRKYPLADGASGIAEILADGLEEYFEFESRFPDTVQSYAYPGAVLEPYAYAVSMFHFLPKEKRRILIRELSGRLALACDPERSYELLLTDHSMLMRTKPDKERVYEYYTGNKIGKMRMFNLYERMEPYTKCRYNLCYFNVSMMLSGDIREGTREEVLNFPDAFVENDWGIGLTFYMIMQSALFSGDWSAVRKEWESLKKIFCYFDLFQDWACMGAGYAENGRTWIEGANFGAFPAFEHMARTLGDTQSEEFAIYLGAKMLALCKGRFFAGAYFAHYYNLPAWYGNRTFQEESIPQHNFQSVPLNLSRERVLPSGVSILTTDAVYPELFESFRESSPQKHRAMMKRYREALKNGLDAHNDVEFTYHIMNDALDPEVDTETVLQNLEIALKTNRFLTRWHDIHRFENFLPENYMKSQILAWLEMRRHPLWLEFWQGMRVMSAKWENGKAVIVCEQTEDTQILFCGVREEIKSFSFSGPRVFMEENGKDSVRFILTGTGTLIIEF